MAACRSSRGLGGWDIRRNGGQDMLEESGHQFACLPIRTHLTVGNPRISGLIFFELCWHSAVVPSSALATHTVDSLVQQHPAETRLAPLGCCRRVVSAVIDRERSGTARETREKRTNGERKKRSSSIRLIRMTRTCCPRRKRTGEGGTKKSSARNRGTT